MKEQKQKILEVDNISKQYRLGLIGTGTISHDINRWWSKLRGKGDPYLKIGEENNRESLSNSDYVWALKDISFDVYSGDVLGIIGKNGAGKSTLLKILSRVSSPTTGTIKSGGRVASLLEVGTGFHPELTGKENIYLNGAILGMTKKEIDSKIDEIVQFSGCQLYMDTPVKRYSSGMRVRLAFAVAAHLEPDILIVDEVLAVGDAEFQKKAIGKMQDISNTAGRTVLFVSHDMSAISRLCTRCILLKNGTIKSIGTTSQIIEEYLNDNSEGFLTYLEPKNDLEKDIQLEKVFLSTGDGQVLKGLHNVREPFFVNLHLKLPRTLNRSLVTFHFKNFKDDFVLFSDINDVKHNVQPLKKGSYKYSIKIDQPLLKPDKYYLEVGITNKDNNQTNHFRRVLNFELHDSENVRSQRAGYIYQELDWNLVE
jgi:lipopolysaccharide transport system ATP-binding protein